MANKQKRGPGFKYASNLPGSLLKDGSSRRDPATTQGGHPLRDPKDEPPSPSPTFTTDTGSPTVPSLDKRKAAAAAAEDREDVSTTTSSSARPKAGEDPLLSKRSHGEGQSRPKLEENPLRKKRKLFDADAEPSARKKVRQNINTVPLECRAVGGGRFCSFFPFCPARSVYLSSTHSLSVCLFVSLNSFPFKFALVKCLFVYKTRAPN